MVRLFQIAGAMRPRVFAQVRNYASGTEAIPTFSETSSPELNRILGSFRQDVFIPAGLPQRQRMSMFKTKHARRLEEEPITVNISETEQFTLRPMEYHSLPTKKDANQAFQLMTSTNEYKNLIPFLKGLRMANFSVSSNRWEQLIRHAGPAGKLNLIVECARQQSETGLSFDKIPVARRLFFEIHRMAQAVDFKGPAAAQALRLAQTTVRTMEWNSSQSRIEAAQDPMCQPFVIGTLLELSAAHAVNELGGKDEGSEVLKYVQKLMASWELGRAKPDFEGQPRHDVALDLWLQEVLPVYNGLKLSLLVGSISNDKPLKATVHSRFQKLKAALKEVQSSATASHATSSDEASHAQSSKKPNLSRSLELADSLLQG